MKNTRFFYTKNLNKSFEVLVLTFKKLNPYILPTFAIPIIKHSY